jgi:hypothetical protein
MGISTSSDDERQFCEFLKQRGLDDADIETACRLRDANPRGTRVVRLPQIYGKGGLLACGKTKFFMDIIYRPGGDELIRGTNVPRLRLANIGERLPIAFEDEIVAIIEALRRERDAKLQSGGSNPGKQAKESVKQHRRERAKLKPAVKERMAASAEQKEIGLT